jgi:hypothetical protein
MNIVEYVGGKAVDLWTEVWLFGLRVWGEAEYMWWLIRHPDEQ